MREERINKAERSQRDQIQRSRPFIIDVGGAQGVADLIIVVLGDRLIDRLQGDGSDSRFKKAEIRQKLLGGVDQSVCLRAEARDKHPRQQQTDSDRDYLTESSPK